MAVSFLIIKNVIIYKGGQVKVQAAGLECFDFQTTLEGNVRLWNIDS